MSRSWLTFNKRMKRIGARIDRNIPATLRKVALAVHTEVVISTPVDTGKARSNWRISLNTPDYTVIEPHAPGSRLGLGETANASAARTQARVMMNAAGRKTRTVYIQNNAHYIGLLNSGSSTQAQPAGFVNRAVLAGTRAALNLRVL